MKYGKSVYRSLVLITQFGINILVPIGLCSYAGHWLDRKLGTAFLVIIFFFVGAMAGFRNVYIFARRIYEDKGDNKHRDEEKNG